MPTINKVQRPWMKKPQKGPGSGKGPNQGRKTNHPEVYHTTRWRKIRELLLQTEPLCRTCLNAKPQRITEATVADHIVSINDGGDPWDMDNLQPQCAKCHNAKSGRERWSKAKDK